MTDAPILSAETILTTAIVTALTPFVGTFNSRPKAYYQLAEQGAPLPYVVFQFQSDITRLDWIGNSGATVLLTIKALVSAAQGNNSKAARDLLALVAPGLSTVAASGYSVAARYVRSPTLPPSGGVAQALHIYRLRIERV